MVWADGAVSSLQNLVEIYISKNDLEKAEKTAQRSIQLGDVETGQKPVVVTRA